MKVTLSTNYLAQNHNKTKVNFGAYRPSINNNGEREHNFYVPYDAKRYNATLELFETKKSNGTWLVEIDKPIKTFDMSENGNFIKMDDLLDLPVEHVAYRYKLTDKNNPNNVRYITDNGAKAWNVGNDGRNANVLYSDRLIMDRPQNAILIMPDMFHAVNGEQRGIKKDSLRNHVNMLGGNLQGIIDKLPSLRDAGYTRIVGTPFTKDDVSSHKYWTQNAYQLSKSLGTNKDFEELQQALVRNGISWVADGAFVNEGLQGVHFKSLLKWGEQSPFRNWFYLTNEASEPLTVGIFPEFNTKNVRFRLVNSKYLLGQDPNTKDITVRKNPDWDASQPTYLQFYDKRLIDSGEENTSGLITEYKNIDRKSSDAITTHDAAINPYYFEINPDEMLPNIIRRNGIKKLDKENPEWDLQSLDTMKDVFSFSKFNFDRKRMGGYVCWDGNVDIPKMNLHVSASDLELYKDDEATKIEKAIRFANGDTTVYSSDPINDRYVGVMQVKDYMVNAGRYWTGLTRDIQVKHVAQLLGDSDNYFETLKELVNDGKLPKSILSSVNETIVNNVVNGDYEINNAPIGTKKELILEAIESLPLDALGFSDELMASFSSPYISKRPFSQYDKNMTRADIAENDYKNIPSEYRDVYKKFDKAIKKQLLDYVVKVMDIANADTEGELYNPNEPNPVVTQKGAEIIKLMVPQLTKQVIEMAIKVSELNLKKDSQRDVDAFLSNVGSITPQSLGINASSPKQEASEVVDKFIKGMKKMASNDAVFELFRDSFADRQVGDFINNTTLESINLAKVIVDRGETGLGWRIDAAKDVSNMDDLREGVTRFDDAWDNVIDVWASFAKAVRRENPNAYLTAEVTDLDDFLKSGKGVQASTMHLQKYKDEHQAELEFLERTGITSFANYKYFYSGIKDLFGASSETGSEGELGQLDKFFEQKFKIAWDGNKSFLEHGPYDAIQGAYNFYENHDKPRSLHTFALDMGLFHGSFMVGDQVQGNRDVARRVIGYADSRPLNTSDFQELNPKAIAMGDALDKAVDKIGAQDKNLVDNFKKAVGEIAQGKYLGNDFDAAAFGVRPFEVVIDQVVDQMKYNGFDMKDETVDWLKKSVLTEILTNSFKTAYIVYKFMATMPGMITDFAGHKQGASGYESLKNNLYQQNRNRINWEWVDKDSPEFIKAVAIFEKMMNDVLAMRNKPELSALAFGDVVVLPKDGDNQGVRSLFRYNDKGSKVVSVYSVADNDKAISRILLNNATEGVVGSVPVGTEFYNAGNSEDTTSYTVQQYDNGDSYIVRYENGQRKDIVISQTEGNVLVLALKVAKNAIKHVTPTLNGIQALSGYKDAISASTLKKAVRLIV